LPVSVSAPEAAYRFSKVSLARSDQGQTRLDLLCARIRQVDRDGGTETGKIQRIGSAGELVELDRARRGGRESYVSF
jgi:hypothetical protein